MKISTKLAFLMSMGVVTTLTITGCSEDKGSRIQPKEFEPISISRSEEAYIEADNAFAYKLFYALDDRNEETKNFIVSPFSASITLAMAANGASGQTLDQILDVLGFDKQDIDGLNSFYKKMLERLPDLDNTTKISVANALWINKKFTQSTYDQFSGAMLDFYSAPITYIDDITSDATRQSINKWYSDNTNGLLSGPSDGKLENETAMLFTNALYFKGFWENNFPKEKSGQKVFRNYDGSSSKVTMMEKDWNCRGYAADGYRALALPYGNKAYSMIIILPNNDRDLDACLKNIDPADVSTLAKDQFSFDPKLMHVLLPKFDVALETDIIPALQDLGLTRMFLDGEAEFTGICDTPGMYISRLNQGVRIIVDEEGTEAASYTEEKGDWLTSPGPILSTDFFVDHAFAFVIAEKSTGLPIFMGRINKL